MFLVFRMSSRGFALRIIKSAQFPSDSVPRSSSPMYWAASRDAATMICIGVRPASAIIAISNRINSDRIDDYVGMARRAPWLAGVLALAMISLTGIPPAVGFWAKIYLFGAAVETNLEWLAVIGVVNSVVSAYYYLRVVKVMFLAAPPTEERVGIGFPMQVAVTAAFIGTLFFGIYPTPLLNLARAAAGVLLS